MRIRAAPSLARLAARVGVGLALAVLLALPAFASAGDTATLETFAGSLDVIRSAQALTLYPGLALQNGDIVNVREGHATLRFADGSETRLRRRAIRAASTTTAAAATASAGAAASRRGCSAAT